jgi:hypothetical protein
MDGEKDFNRKEDKYRKYLEITTLLIVTLIDLILIAIVPNPLGLAEHLYVIGAAIIIVAVLYYYATKDRGRPDDEGPDEESEDATLPPEYEEDAVRDVGEVPLARGSRKRRRRYNRRNDLLNDLHAWPVCTYTVDGACSMNLTNEAEPI